MVDLQCQLSWLWNHSGDTPLPMSVRSFQRGFTEEGVLTLNVGGTIPWTPSHEIKREEEASQAQTSTSVDTV